MHKLIEKHKFQISMSRKGDPWDNAMMESFFGKLKTEWADHIYKTHDDAKINIFKYIETFYNPVRRPSSLGNISPMEYERRYEAGELTDMAAQKIAARISTFSRSGEDGVKLGQTKC